MTGNDFTTQASYIDRVGRVRAHIHAHLDDPLDLDALADVAAMSRFHWHRVYRAMTGETVFQTVKRLRLARAAEALARSPRPITDIAVQAGYTSQAAFSRAFASAYGRPPADFRAAGMHSALETASKENNAMAFPIEIKQVPERAAIGLLHKGPYPEIGATYDRLFTELAKQNLLEQVRGVCGTYKDDPDSIAPEDLRSHACIYVDEGIACDSPLEARRVGGGDYGVLLYKGPYAAMKPAYDWLFGTWLPASGREARDAPCIEINLNTPDTTAPADLLTEICLPLKEQ